MVLLTQLRVAPLCSRLLALSVRNLSISSKAATQNYFPTSTGGLINPLIARANGSLIKDLEISGPLWRKKEIIDLPLTNKVIENPMHINKVVEDVTSIDKTIDLPTIDNKTGTNNEKQAKNGMIMIRRIKMNKHKRKKLRKKMKFEWAKVRQRREWRKEKAFTSELVAQIKEAEKFSAEQFVAEKIKQATETPLPRSWKGRRLPEFIIKEKVAQEAQRKLQMKLKLWEHYGSQ